MRVHAKPCERKSGPYRSRTDTPFRETDFESVASANSAKGPISDVATEDKTPGPRRQSAATPREKLPRAKAVRYIGSRAAAAITLPHEGPQPRLRDDAVEPRRQGRGREDVAVAGGAGNAV